METLNTGSQTTDTTPAPEGHDQAMMDAVDKKEQELAQIGQEQSAPAETQEQEKILGKFESQADLEKAYQELEKKLGSRQESDDDGKTDDKADGEMDEDKASDLIIKANVDVDAIADHFYANGGLADSHYEELEKAGIPKAYVDQYISGVQAEGEQMREALFEEIGGEESFTAMSSWATVNLSESELAAYNQTMETGDLDAVRSAVMSLAFRFERANGKDPQLIGGQGKSAEGQGFESVAQLTEAMKDPRYQSDSAYRANVEAKLARSSIL
ncbi:capsid assembly protein [Endozoicomonas ascidiicola]|uniref:capsid assembly protein n=1 Tax=Endozoicomonas ascidiicola TaxID=1698521 RepID=UPI0008357E1E|nr:capsid assembly protein [Endozoicomonas ascidiicola]